MRLSLPLLAVLVLFTAPPAWAVTGDVNAFFGTKTLDSADWAPPFDDQGEFGVLFDISDRHWPVSLAIDLLGSSRQEDYWDGYTYTSTSELDLGVRKIFDIHGTDLHPYVGGGLALVNASVEDVYYWSSPCGRYDCGDNADGTGIWLNGGIYWSFWGHFNVGLDLRYSQADVTLRDAYGYRYTLDAGGTHSGLLLGYRW